MLTMFAFIIVLGLLVFVHEFGHFIVAKRAGIKVEEFGFGFPPRIVGVRKGLSGKWKIIWLGKEIEKDGSTLYSLNWVPVGGFVRIKGEGGDGVREHDSFASRKIVTRLAVVCAGVFMNLVLAVVLLTIGFSIGIPQEINGTVSKYAHVSDQHFEIVGVVANAPAEEAGVVAGDRIIEADQTVFGSAQAFRDYISEHNGKKVSLHLTRDGKPVDVAVTPRVLTETQKPGIGVMFSDVGIVRYPIWLAVWKSMEGAGRMVVAIFQTLGSVVHDLVLGQKVSMDVTGPIGIAVMTGQVVRMGWVYLLQFVAVLSLNLAVINVFPFPALDGGKMLLLIIEKFRRKPLTERVELLIHNFGFVILLGLVAVVTYRDLVKYGGSFTKFISRLF